MKDIKIKNLEILKRVAQEEYDKLTEKHPTDFSKLFDVSGYTTFNNKLIRIQYWHSNNCSGYGFSQINYNIHVEPTGKKTYGSCYTFNTNEEAECFLKKTKSKDFPDKPKVKIKKEWDLHSLYSGNLNSMLTQLENETKLLEFKKTFLKIKN